MKRLCVCGRRLAPRAKHLLCYKCRGEGALHAPPRDWASPAGFLAAYGVPKPVAR